MVTNYSLNTSLDHSRPLGHPKAAFFYLLDECPCVATGTYNITVTYVLYISVATGTHLYIIICTMDLMPNTLQLRYEKEDCHNKWLYFYGTKLQTKRVDMFC